jgi:hypothetical protein
VPEDDSVIIGNTRYMLSVINLEGTDFDPNSLPYPPVFWPQFQYWQFANRHNPYIDVGYTGADQKALISRAQADTARIGLQSADAQEPMQMYLDTDTNVMTVWPIYAFLYATSSQTVDLGQLKAINDTILGILKTILPSTTGPTSPFDAEQIMVPGALQQANPYTSDAATSGAANPMVDDSLATAASETSISGLAVTNLSPNFVANTSVQGIPARQSLELLQSQQVSANQAITKSLAPAVEVTQAVDAATATRTDTFARRQYQPIYGFSIYNAGTGEAYIVEVVGTDLTTPNQLPSATQNVTYDPYYVRVVFLNALTCYNMSIIVPSMVYDQYGHFAHQATAYQNLLSKTNELGLGYVFSLYDGSNNFDNLTFSPWPALPAIADFEASPSNSYLFTNLPYSTGQTGNFNPISLFGQFSDSLLIGGAAEAERRAASFDSSLILYNTYTTPPAYFVCRRQNWSADCHLMQATQPAGKSVYLAFGAGNLVPFRLDADFEVDKRSPAHMYKLTYTFADQQYDSAKAIPWETSPTLSQ